MATALKLELQNGVSIPQLGLGVWRASDGDEVEQAVAVALASGYRLIDTAAVYGNEAGVGRAIGASGVPREALFITTKLWNDSHHPDAARRAFDASLDRLSLSYVDLYLIHWPLGADEKLLETWRVLEELYDEGLCKAIGVSNCKPHHLEAILPEARIMPMVNQIELHPRLQQHDTRALCAKYNIQVESYSPIMQGGGILDDPKIKIIADGYGKSPAQVVLRWHLQHGLVAIPKSVTHERIRSNIDIFDFELGAGDMATIDAMDDGTRLAPDPIHYASDLFYMVNIDNRKRRVMKCQRRNMLYTFTALGDKGVFCAIWLIQRIA